MLLDVISQSLVFFPLTLGIFFSYEILRTTDLTVDGSFVLGAAIYAKLISLDCSPVLSLMVAVLGGFVAGLGVSLIQKKERISPLLAGILAVFILSSLNLQIMGMPNIGILSKDTIFSRVNQFFGSLTNKQNQIIFLMGCTSILFFSASLLMRTRLGLLLKGYGDNRKLLSQLNKSEAFYRTLGLGMSNALVAFCGGLTADFNGYADISMGTGIVLIGIGTVVIGRQLAIFLSEREIPGVELRMFCCFLGVITYFYSLSLFVRVGIDPLHLKWVVSLALIFFLYHTGKKGAGGSSHA